MTKTQRESLVKLQLVRIRELNNLIEKSLKDISSDNHLLAMNEIEISIFSLDIIKSTQEKILEELTSLMSINEEERNEEPER